MRGLGEPVLPPATHGRFSSARVFKISQPVLKIGIFHIKKSRFLLSLENKGASVLLGTLTRTVTYVPLCPVMRG